MSIKEKIMTLAIVVGGVQAYSVYSDNKSFSQEVVASEKIHTSKKRHVTKTYNFSCDGREYCSQMTSREEAVFFIRNCPNTKMDGDDDGIPCENDSRW